MTSPLVMLIVQELPGFIKMFKELFEKENPDEPVPSEEEIFAAFETAFQSSLAKDDLWLRFHPKPQ